MSATKKNSLAIADILLLQQQVRSKNTINELGYFLVNDTRKIAPYQVAIFYRHFQKHKKIESISGIPMPVKEAPFYIWLSSLCKIIVTKKLREPTILSKTSEVCNFKTHDIAEWDDFLPAKILWLPLLSSDGVCIGGMLLTRLEDWKADELRILHYWSSAIATSVELLSLKNRSIFSKLKNIKTAIWLGILVILFELLFVPVTLSVLAQAEVVPKDPIVIRAPLEGVIGEVLALPNKTVEKKALLITLDDSELKSRIDVAVQELEIAKAEYRRAEQISVLNREAAAEIPMLAARIEQRYAEVKYIKSLLKRINIHASDSGIAIIPDAYELEGKPVQLGERLLTIAKSDAAELEMWLAVGDSIELPEKSKIELFLNVSPDKINDAQLSYVNFQAEMSPEGQFAFRARADFLSQDEMPRIGLRGTAKIYGKEVPLYYYLFRRPIAVARQWLGV